MSKCSNCGAPMENGICTYCNNTSIQEEKFKESINVEKQINYQGQGYSKGNSVSPKSKWTAFFLCLIFGIFGFHKFYAGKIGMGVLYFFTAGLLGFGWIIDLVLILTGTFKDENGLPLVR
ncbi:MAG: TM2 domain-containing protein [Erysipelothrix sp.]